MQLILSLFSGIGMLDLGFKEAGFCVVSAGDTILGQHHDIHNFHATHGRFDGVIGGSPCQDFSKLNRKPDRSKGIELMNEFKRVVIESGARWFLLENVPESPDLFIDGYKIQRFMLNAKNCTPKGFPVQNRNRKFQFGSTDGLLLTIKREPSPVNIARCVTASEGKSTERRTVEDFCELQGLPRDFDLPDFNKEGFYRAVGNGVNVHVSRKIAFAIRDATEGRNTRTITDVRFCICGCGETVEGKQKHYNSTCRKRMQIKREHTRSKQHGRITETNVNEL